MIKFKLSSEFIIYNCKCQWEFVSFSIFKNVSDEISGDINNIFDIM